MLSAGCGGPTKKFPTASSATIAGALAAPGPKPEVGKAPTLNWKVISSQVTCVISKLKDEMLG